MDITIAIATHKKYKMPNDVVYLPIHVGADLGDIELDYAKDNVGENISKKNLNYCELTSLYWIWKNCNSDYKGLVHYRRHFSNKELMSTFSKGRFENILTKEKLDQLLQDFDVILPKKRKYYIETIENHYKHTHHEEDLIVAKKVLRKLYPEYEVFLDEVLKSKSAHMFNMMIMKQEFFDNYCIWLFKILFEIEKVLDISGYSDFHKRVYGRLSEILLDVWIKKNDISYKELPVMYMEEQNWILKGTKFLKAKFLKTKY